MLNFLGAGMRLGMISNQTAVNGSLSGVGGTATAKYRLQNSGQAQKTNVSGTYVNISGEWLVGAGPVSDFEVFGTWGTDPGGSIGGATPDTWLGLGTTREFTFTVENNNLIRTLTLQIRYIPTLTVVDTAVITFEVDSAP